MISIARRAAAAATVAAAVAASCTTPGERTLSVPPCELPRSVLERVWRGYVPGRSGDVLAVERLPNQYGTRHSTPFPYTQDVPLVLYGPGFIRAGVTSGRDVTLADIAPTMAELLGFDDWPERDGRVLTEALLPERDRAGTPSLIFTLVWDGGGDNVLRRWPGAWPVLAGVARRGASYERATVGSSPSITPAVHATIGTGAFPAAHGIPDIKMRVRGKVVDAWAGLVPDDLRLATLADLWDLANRNEPVVGVMARDGWHLGMMGRGALHPGGDNDIAILDRLGGTGFHTNRRFYSMPPYVGDPEALADAVAEVDGRDGEIDGRWLGNPISASDGLVRYTPAFSIYQSEQIMQVLGRERFGRDGPADLFFTNYKSTDLAGHQWNMVLPEVRDVLAEQDAQLGVLIRALDDLVGGDRYVLVITADHGMTPEPRVTGGWSIDTGEIERDLNRRFGRGADIVLGNRGYMYMLDKAALRRARASPADVAAWLRDYRIEDNVKPGRTVPRAWRGRTDERVFVAAFTPPQLERTLRCAGPE